MSDLKFDLKFLGKTCINHYIFKCLIYIPSGHVLKSIAAKVDMKKVNCQLSLFYEYSYKRI